MTDFEQLKPETVTFLRSKFARGPVSKHLRLALETIEKGHVTMRMPKSEKITNLGGNVHGGMVAALVDAASAVAAWATDEVKAGTRGITVGFSISYVGPTSDTDLVADCRIVSQGGTLTIVDVEVFNDSGQVAAKAVVTYKLDLARDRRIARDSRY